MRHGLVEGASLLAAGQVRLSGVRRRAPATLCALMFSRALSLFSTALLHGAGWGWGGDTTLEIYMVYTSPQNVATGICQGMPYAWGQQFGIGRPER